MGRAAFAERNLDHVPFGPIGRLANGFGDFPCLAGTETDASIVSSFAIREQSFLDRPEN